VERSTRLGLGGVMGVHPREEGAGSVYRLGREATAAFW
jgi:hypothetical protein